jgi:hypothetical protein
VKAWSFVFLGTVAVFVTACEKQTGPQTFPATGTIVMAGSPVAEALVVFTPKDNDDQSVLASQAETDADGKFAMRTYLGDDDYKNGIQPGEYVVTVTKLEVVQDMRRRPKHLLPRKYSRLQTTDLSASVTVSSENNFELVLK